MGNYQCKPLVGNKSRKRKAIVFLLLAKRTCRWQWLYSYQREWNRGLLDCSYPVTANSVRSSTGLHCPPPFGSPGKEAIVAFCSYLSLSHFPGPIAHSALVIVSLPAACVSFFSWALIDSKSDSTLLSVIGLNVACAQSCLTLCDPMACSPPGSSVHGVSQARILEWVAISSSRRSSQPRDQSQVRFDPGWTGVSFVSCIDRHILCHWHHLGSQQAEA